ncbi:MAG: glycosyltransferase [Bacteroidetes bacterium]|nr:glycosyltransferase [Bacteroidota bacterium]MBS1628783.1 glycosyltransferase [Bacteroidota bacterium]
MPSRILILTNRVPYPLHDGGALAMDALIRGYHQAGWQVHVLAMNTSRHPVAADKLSTLYPQIAGFHTVAMDNNIRPAALLKNLLFSREPEHASRFRSDLFAEKLSSLLTKIQPQVVQLESPFLAGYIPLIRQVVPCKVVYRAHNIESQIWLRLAQAAAGPRAAYLRNLARRMTVFEQKLWQEADLIAAITEADARVMQAQHLATPVVVVPFGIAAPEQTFQFPPLPLRLYHIGAMDWLPNREALQWFLQEVWPKLYAQLPELSFHFAGRAMPDVLKERLPAGAFCAGEVGDAASFISDKHLLVVPLRSGSGIRVKTLEGMAAGKLVISTDVGMQGIDAEAGRQYLRANTSEEFMAQIAWAAAHTEEVIRISGSAAEFLRERYDARKIMQAFLPALQS